MDSELLERADDWIGEVDYVAKRGRGATDLEGVGQEVVRDLLIEVRRQGEDVDGFTTVLCDLVRVMHEVGQSNMGGRLRRALRRAASDTTTGRAATVVTEELEAAASV